MKYLLIGFSIVYILARFINLEQAPTGFYNDESAGAINIICMAEQGTNENGTPFPLFFPQFGGFFTAPYVYFGALWVKVFGYSISSFRAIAAFFSVLTIIGIYFLAQILGTKFIRTNDLDFSKNFALLSLFMGAISPWSFQFSRIVWDPPLMPCFIIWGLYFYFRDQKYSYLISGVLLSLAMYSYSVARVIVPLLILLLVAIQFYKKRFSFKNNVFWGIGATIPSLPLVYYTLNGHLQSRFNVLSVFGDYYLNQVGNHSIWFQIHTFFYNIYLHFSPQFLFTRGDANLRHSSQYVGQLSWVESITLLIGIALFVKNWKKLNFKSDSRLLCLILIAGIFFSVLPSAMTWEGVPHSLRSLGAWPFYSMLCALIIAQGYKKLTPIVLAVTLMYTPYYFYHYFIKYPKDSYIWFDTHIKEAALRAEVSQDWQGFVSQTQNYAAVSKRYYLVRYGKMSCKESGQISR